MTGSLRGREWGTALAVAGLTLALFLVALDQTVVGTALPQIIADLEGLERYAWVTIAYLLASTAMIPVVGKLGGVYGRMWFIVGGAAWVMLERGRAVHASKTVIWSFAARGTDETR